MIDFPNITDICRATESKIVMVVVDGLGGMRHPHFGMSELESAEIPVLDGLASQSDCGVTTPVLPGISPGSGPGHMGLFGYDPLKYLVGRGVLEGMGIGIDIPDGFVAARGNFCIVDSNGLIIDRRAHRIDSGEGKRLCKVINERIKAESNGNSMDITFEMFPVMDYRFVLLCRNATAGVTMTDPQVEGVRILDSKPLELEDSRMAAAINGFSDEVSLLLAEDPLSTANAILLRGFSTPPKLPDFGKTYNLNAAAIAGYPMYRGLASLLGMKILESQQDFADEIRTLTENFQKFNFFFVHYKPADSAGEDGDFGAKVQSLEYFDSQLHGILDLNPDVLVVCGDHSTPAYMENHSWHPVPFLVKSKYSESYSASFTERECRNGTAGRIRSEELMLMALAHAGKLNRFGP